MSKVVPILLLLFCGYSALAQPIQQVVVPNGLANVEGNSSTQMSAPSPTWKSPIAAGYFFARMSANRYTAKMARKMAKMVGATLWVQRGSERPATAPPDQKVKSAESTNKTYSAGLRN